MGNNFKNYLKKNMKTQFKEDKTHELIVKKNENIHLVFIGLNCILVNLSIFQVQKYYETGIFDKIEILVTGAN